MYGTSFIDIRSARAATRDLRSRSLDQTFILRVTNNSSKSQVLIRRTLEMSNAIYYFSFAAENVVLLRELNSIVQEPYMVCILFMLFGRSNLKSAKDEPFHVPQVQAYCRGDWNYWDPKLTTPPGL